MNEVIVDKRLIKTYFSKKPSGAALAVTLFILAFSGVLSRLYWLGIDFSSHLAASKELVFNQHEYWRLFTTTFIHGDLGHFLGNAYMLGILGFFVYTYFGSIIFPGIGVVLAGAVNAITIWNYPPQVTLVGASGLVYLLAGFWLMMFIFIERKRAFTRRIVIAGGAGLLILFPTSFEENVSYLAHGVGLGIGALLGIIYFALNWQRIRKAEVWQVSVDYPEDDPQFSDQSVDL